MNLLYQNLHFCQTKQLQSLTNKQRTFYRVPGGFQKLGKHQVFSWSWVNNTEHLHLFSQCDILQKFLIRTPVHPDSALQPLEVLDWRRADDLKNNVFCLFSSCMSWICEWSQSFRSWWSWWSSVSIMGVLRGTQVQVRMMVSSPEVVS